MTDDMLDLPAFLRRTDAGPTRPPIAPEPVRYIMPPPTAHLAPGAKDLLARAVAAVVAGGADTWGKIVKASAGDPAKLRRGLRAAIRARLVEKTGRRYHRTAKP